MGRTHDTVISNFDLDALETELACTKRQLVEERELANRLEEENADVFLRRWAKAQERAIDAERERDAERALADRLAEALKGIWPFIRGCNSTEYMNAIELCRANITAWKEARND